MLDVETFICVRSFSDNYANLRYVELIFVFIR